MPGQKNNSTDCVPAPMAPRRLRAARPSRQERLHLEAAHDELCTALTILRTSVAVASRQIARGSDAHPQVIACLGEAEHAVDRLQVLARQMRAWRGP